MSDLIDRDRAINEIRKLYWTAPVFDPKPELYEMEEAIRKLPPEGREHQIGHWIYVDRPSKWGGKAFVCSLCGRGSVVPPEVFTDLYKYEKYCRHCGARMEPKE